MDRPLAAITGASAGLGVEFAHQLAARSYDLLLIARRPERLKQVAERIMAIHNVECATMAADLTNDADLRAVEERLSAAADLALLVNNAGFGTLGMFWENSVASQDAMHRLHVMAPMRLCRAVLPRMIERNRGDIINVSSVAGFALSAGSTSYCATKTWMNRFTEGLYLELRAANSRVKVQALCPGYTRTEFHATLEMDTSRIPNWMWLPAERVVRESLRGLDRGELFVVPGQRYKSLLRAYSLLPQGLRHRFAVGAAGLRRKQT